MRTNHRLLLPVSAVVLLVPAACGDRPTSPANPSEGGSITSVAQEARGGKGGKSEVQSFFSYGLSGGYVGTYEGAPAKDNGRELSFGAVGEVSIDFPSVTEADCTFSDSVTSQAIRDNLLALTHQETVQRDVSFILRKKEGTGTVRAQDVGGGAPQVMMCWSTGLGFCPYEFVGTSQDDPTTRREFRFPGGGNNALRLLLSEGLANEFTVYEAICLNDDPVTVVVEPIP